MYVGVKWLVLGVALISLGSVALEGSWQTAVIVGGNVAFVYSVVSMIIEWNVRRRLTAADSA